MSSASLRARLEQAIAGELAASQQDRDVLAAIAAAESAVAQVPASADEPAEHAAIVDAIVRAHLAYRARAEDRDGFGSATLHAIRRAAAALRPPGRRTADEERLDALGARANAGDAGAAYVLASHYLGRSTERLGGPTLLTELDDTRAAALLRVAAEAGHVEAQFELGRYHEALAFQYQYPWEQETARRWYRRAAEAGHAEAKRRSES